jgi:general secretion pathway protein D
MTRSKFHADSAPQAPSLRALALAIGLTLLPCIAPQLALAQSGSREPVTLNFVNADIEAVARTMAAISGRNVVVDPRVKGAISLATDRPVSPAAALNQFGAALRLQGFTLVDTGGLYKIVPEADAKLQGNPVNAGPVNKLGSSNQIVTQIFNLNHESANNLVPVLRPLIGPNNTINVNPGTNALVITDYADNLQRIGRIISALDVAGASDVEVIPLQHAIAADLVPMVSRLLDQPVAGAGGQGDPSYKTTVMAEPRSNAVVMRAANPARLALVRSLVTKLDQPNSIDASGNIHVVYLKNADAVALATTLRAAMAGDSGSASSSGASAGASASAAPQRTASTSQATAPVAAVASPSTGGQIQADPATNSLIITAPEPQYRQLRAVIDKLDERRAQVYVESLIAEVNADKASEFGIQWQSPLGSIGNSTVGLLGTNFGTGGNNILTNLLPIAQGDTTSITAPSTGFNLGLASMSNGVYILGMLARFLQTSGEGNVLSTPNLLTLDNQEAKIVVGQNVPFVTGQYTSNNSSSGSVNPFQTIERKDVGITLRVKPQISENGTIKMTIYQEVSAVQASSLNSTTGIITTQRTIESTVLVQDGGVVVLGGLLQDEFSGNQEKVPGLGDVPLFGNLFKSETRNRKKTNLMIFLRPVILRDAKASNSLSLDRYDMMRGAQKEAQPVASKVLQLNDAPVLPPQRAPVTDAVPTTPAAQ